MPRTTTVECSGCPPLRALTFDSLGLIKVVEARDKQGEVPKVVDRWGDPDSSKCVLAASFDDSRSNPLLAVARRSGEVEILNPLNGDVHVAISAASNPDIRSNDDAIVGLHLFKRQQLEQERRTCNIFTCTAKGNASLRCIDVADLHAESSSIGSVKMWKVCNTGNILCSKVDSTDKFALFGGKSVEVNVWDLEKCSKIWTAKPTAKNNLGIFTPTWFTSATFLSKDDHRKFVAGTNSHQVRVYDISAQRRPVISFDFRETTIKAIAEDLDGYTIYVGNGSGDLASFDTRTGKLLGCFLGKCSGSIRSIVRHSEHPVIASCGLDSYLRFWDINSRQLLSAVFLKQHLNAVVLCSSFGVEELAQPTENSLLSTADIQIEDQIETLAVRRKKFREEEGCKKKPRKNNVEAKNQKSKKRSKKVKAEICDD
ncbi:WD repeat-containing protein 74 [Carica papaya]|uniref:WD repeat-containing protein 74 n=1 Tax=Carica papaya TaxID=3649 RepID=UPI000B8CCF81|nr:WD repeat-containing protein 74 [Carica papaya]